MQAGVDVVLLRKKQFDTDFRRVVILKVLVELPKFIRPLIHAQLIIEERPQHNRPFAVDQRHVG